MTPSKTKIRSCTSLLLEVYLEAAEVTDLHIRVDEGCEKPVLEVSRHCRRDLEELAKEE